MLGYAGFRGPFALVPMAGGKNNQVYRVDLADRSLVLKAYFQHPGDTRDRLGAEYAFSSFAWNYGLRCLPQPITCDPDARMALYEFVPGRKLVAGEVTRERVAEAAAFFTQLNRLAGHPAASRLHDGSEACFRLSDHLHCLARRIERLQQIEPASPVDQAAAQFVATELDPLCRTILEDVAEQALGWGFSLTSELPPADRRLSPSDFGFHNALLTPAGTMTFLDFEYAGWDDPAKTVGDFFSQPELPAPAASFEEFAEAVSSGLPDPARHRQRFKLLLPVYRLKWCCIMLNDFLPTGNQRRQFAGEFDDEQRKARQLAKARQAAAAVGETVPRRAAA